MTSVCPRCGYEITGDDQRRNGRGRKLGSTNWSQQRFWLKYTWASKQLKRPYRKTHLADLIGLRYTTFLKYLSLWGPPPRCAAPGE
jgi:predicted amidophosphoribosyltransferase